MPSLPSPSQDEVLAAAKASSSSDWRVLLLDATTTPLVSAAARVSDTLDAGISLIEDLHRPREPLPAQEAVYFISPGGGPGSPCPSVARLLEDWTRRPASSPPYAGAHVFFASTPAAGDLAAIKACAPLLARLRSLRDAGLAFVAVDPRAAVTAPGSPLVPLYGPAGPDGEPPGQRAALGEVAARLATLVTSLGAGPPTIRFRAPLPPAAAAAAVAAGGPPPRIDARALLPQRLALDLHGRLQAAAASGTLPPHPGGRAAGGWDLVIVPRAWDALAPLAHDWCYGPLAADVGVLGGPRAGPPTFTHAPETGGGAGRGGRGGSGPATASVEHVLDPRTDPLWGALRGRHFAAAAADLARRLDEFRAKNTAAAYKGGESGTAAAAARAAAAPSSSATAAAPLDSRSLKALVSALPQYRAQLALLGAHTALAARVGAAVDAGGLVEVGRLEEGLAFGEATSRDLIAFLAGPPAAAASSPAPAGGAQAQAQAQPPALAAPPDARLRLLLLYAATHPGKLDAVKEAQWARLARLPGGGGDRPAAAAPAGPAAAFDFSRALTGLEALGVPVRKESALAGGGGGGGGGGKGGGGGGLAAAAAAALGFGPRKPGRRTAPTAGGNGADAAGAGEEDGGLILGRLQPAVGDLFSAAAAGRLDGDEFPAVAPPEAADVGGARGSGMWGGGGSGAIGRAGSVRSVHSAAGWARKARGAGGEQAGGSGPAQASPLPATSTRPILVFVVGGITPGEARAAAAASARTGRDCFIAGTAWDTPATFLAALRELGGLDYSHED